MRSHISVHRATTKYFSNSFVFKTEIEKEGLPGDITPALGAGGLRFKSGRPDQNHLPYFLQVMKSAVHSKLHCGILADRRSGFASCLVSESSPHDEFCKNMGGRRAIQKPLNGSKLNARQLARMGKIQGTLCISGPINLRKWNSGDQYSLWLPTTSFLDSFRADHPEVGQTSHHKCVCRY
jgi:hypothetical protein